MFASALCLPFVYSWHTLIHAHTDEALWAVAACEVADVIGVDGASLTTSPSPAQVSSLHFLEACIYEALRVSNCFALFV
jgi:hypothetical protein